jgi:hypothetical protein
VFADAQDLSIPVMGYIVASRRPRDPIGWLALTAGLALCASTFCTSYALRALYAAGSLQGARAAMWISDAVIPVPIGVVAFPFLLFPTGRVRSRRWLPVAWFEAAVFALSRGDERLQLKWFAAAAVLVPLTIIPAILTQSTVAVVLLNARSSA